ncbi:bifunctional diguanylate cyclase/phosphodiesterase [uncultured Aquitalea sp.]|uniref:sensor domain-containing protein n=1 Tax=uncultured Aquitalea sp. TaxID=540272 RepID=UPI0025D252CD|nr:bifunctional diguanylate cyclase/phosphodiesterase [uncultured Aquitalea sp.]
MADLSLAVAAVRDLLAADAVCLWFVEAESVAVPVASAPADWMSRPCVLPMADQPWLLTVGEAAADMLPLSLRAREALGHDSAVLLARRQLSATVNVGLLALWRQRAPPASGLEKTVEVLLTALGQNIWQSGAGVSLLEEDPHLHALADALPQGIVIVPLDGRMGFVNHTAAGLLGIAKGETLPAPLSQALRRLIERAINAEEVSGFVLPLLGGLPPDDELRSITMRLPAGQALRLTIAPVGDSQTSAWAWLLDDISHETALQDKLSANEHKFRHFYQTMQDAVAFYDQDGQLTEGNAALLKLLDWPQQPVAHAFDLGWQVETWQNMITVCLAHGFAPMAERQLPRADGAVVFVEFSCHVRRDSAGRVTGWYEVMHDITQRKASEARLRLAATVFERHAEGEVLTDASHIILACNSAFVAMTGYSHDELRGQTPRLLHSDKHNDSFYLLLRQQIHARGWWQGGIWSRTKSGELFFKWLTINALRDEAGNITHFVGLYREPEAVNAAQGRIAYLATHDSLTRLHNRQWLEDRLAHLLSASIGKVIGVAVLQLDNLHSVLGTLGQQDGDELIRRAAARLREVGQDAIASARLSDDRFALVLEAVSIDQLSDTAHWLLQALNTPSGAAADPHMTWLLGLSAYPEHSDRADALLLNAQAALMRLKEAGGSGCLLYSADMRKEITRRFQLENGLRAALEKDELFLHYQPQIAAHSHRLAGCEALVRWRRGQNIVPPGEFIPVAERSDLIIPLTRWVLRRVCLDLQLWDKQGLAPPVVSVNISARHFQRPDMVDDLLAIVREHGISPYRLCLEITEGLLAEPEQTSGKLLALKTAGFHISIDDFGTGFSSLSYLKHFALDEIKIDRSFVEHLFDEEGDQAIALAILAIARSLSMRVVAEGVETLQQAAFFRQHGCELLQGYLFAKPMAAEALADLLLRPGGPFADPA